MPFNELKGLERELFLKAKVEELQKIYGDAQKSLTKKLKKIDITDFQKTRTQALLVQVNAEIGELNKSVRSWSKSSIPSAYEEGIALAEDRLQAMKVTKFVNYDAQIHTSAVNVLTDQTTLDLLTANQSIKNNANRYIRLTQQRILEDKQISRLISQGLLEGEPRRTVSDSILKEFNKKLDAGQMITINGRNYNPKHYSKLLARTRFVESSNQASINTSLQYGVDLMQVSVHSLGDQGEDDPCRLHQGKIYSLSGGDPDFPPLKVTPPYHPHCKHFLLPITRESLEDRGLLEGASKFSKSKAKTGNFTEFEKEVANEPYAPPPRPKRGHLAANLSTEKKVAQVSKDMAIGRNEARDIVNAVEGYTGSEYSTIRDYQMNPALFKSKHSDSREWMDVRQQGKLLEQYLKQSPSFDGGLFRGIDTKGSEVGEQWLRSLKVGGFVSDAGTTSWTSSRDIAQGFGNTVIRVKSIRNSASIRHLSVNKEEVEALVGKDTRFKILKISEVKHDYKGMAYTSWIVDAEEVF